MRERVQTQPTRPVASLALTEKYRRVVGVDWFLSSYIACYWLYIERGFYQRYIELEAAVPINFALMYTDISCKSSSG